MLRKRENSRGGYRDEEEKPKQSNLNDYLNEEKKKNENS